MEITDPKILAYLHDARVFAITYDLKNKESRSILLPVRCHYEAGYPAWDGKRLLIRLEDIVLFSFYAVGAIVAEEEINMWDSVLSGAMETKLAEMEHASHYHYLGVRFSVVFQSGSCLQGFCKRITVEEIAEPADK